MTEQKTEKKSEIKPLTEDQQQERAEQIELIIRMFPKLAKDKAQSVIRFAGMLCDLAVVSNVDPLEYMVKAIAQYREVDRRIEAEAASSEETLKGTGDYYCNDCDFSCMDQVGMEPFPCPECENGTMYEETGSNE